ncbi:MAG TPA: DUF1566 domain-containing protein [Terracidiphilus sp.]|jgi:hypothetical protein
MRPFHFLVTVACLTAIAGCSGASRNDPGLTSPSTPQPTNTVSGTVTFKGAALAGVTITLWLTNSNVVVSTATTDSNGNYSFSGLSTSGNVPADYQIYANKAGYAFYPSAPSPGKVERFDHTGQFIESQTLGVAMYFTVIDFVSLPNAPLAGADFTAYDGTNPLVSLAATGQTESYASGDDGALKQGAAWPATRFTDNQDGSVTNNLTGLIWLKDAGCFAPATWPTALADVNQLASGACGLSDGSTAGKWRLPNLNELESLIDVSSANPALAPSNRFINVGEGIYWTSTGYYGGVLGSPTAWVIRLSDGAYVNDSLQNLKAASTNGVWAVRGPGNGAARLQATGLFQPPLQTGDDGTLQMGVPLAGSRFIENGDGTVTDAMTGLVWLKQANCIQGDWATAVVAVTKLASGQCGLTDGSAAGTWRMPNRKEMQSLADRNINNESDYLNFTYLNPDHSVYQRAILTYFVEAEDYWTSSTYAADTTEAWSVYSCDFGVYNTPKSAIQYTLAVRNATD